MKKNYISNSTESVRMFKSNFMESLSKVHFTVPLIIYVPAICYFIYKSFSLQVGLLFFLLYFLCGLMVWTITEYLLHRYIFHFEPKSEWGKRIHFIFHGVHHDYPQDTKRLVMPPSASIPLAILFYLLFSLFFQNKSYLLAFFAGFITGYLLYDMLHYAIHHHNFKSPLMKKLKVHHMLHHYADPAKGYGVSSVLWDIIFKSNFPEKKKSVSNS
ncbi:MAG TPA: sterol desaturase family protein [Hanamia sp.]|nr:sterol desaturase family protein [Hanamia sp.]